MYPQSMFEQNKNSIIIFSPDIRSIGVSSNFDQQSFYFYLDSLREHRFILSFSFSKPKFSIDAHAIGVEKNKKMSYIYC